MLTHTVLKAKPITNATSGDGTAANIIQQISLAITYGYDCTIQKQNMKFNSIYIITSHTISNTARDSLNKRNFPGLEFQVGSDLLPLIDEYLPKFYYYTSGLHAQLAQALQDKCEKLNELKNIPITKSAVEVKSLIDIYVKPRLRKIETRRKMGGRKNKQDIVVKTPQEILKKKSRVIITGEAGSGKSLTLREFVLTQLSENTRAETPNLPLLVKAYDLGQANADTFEDILTQVIRKTYNVSEFSMQDLQGTQLTLLVDGLDEIVNVEGRKRIKEKIFQFGLDYPSVSIIITSRRTHDINDLENMSTYERWDILPFNLTQVENFVENWFQDKVEVGHKLLATLQDHELLEKMPNTPLVLTLLAILFDSDDYREIPSNLAELYKMFLDLLLGRWNLDRRVDTMYDANIREHIAQEIALHLHKSEALSLSVKDCKKIITEQGKKLGIELEPDKLIDEFVDQTALLILNDKRELEFRHLSFQEFLVAQNVYNRGEDEDISINFLIDHFEVQWWTRTLYFYCGLRQNNPEILQRVMERTLELEGFKQCFNILEFGYLIQTSYLTSIELRIELVEVALRQYYQNIDQIREIEIGSKSIAEGIIFTIFAMWLTQQYSSGVLSDHYKALFEKLYEETVGEETGFVLLALALFVAEYEQYKLMTKVHPIIKTKAKQILALDILGDHILEGLSSSEKNQPDAQDLKETLKKTKKWLKAHPDITKAITQPQKKLS